MHEGDAVSLEALRAEQHFTEPPPRFSEASLVKALEEHGIGRPSTYATIISTLQDREYVEMDSRRFVPTDIGKIVCRFLTSHFHRYVEYGFTAAMEDELDAVSRGEEDWTVPLEKFWKPFIHQVDKIEKTVTREQVAQARELGKDAATGKPVTVRMGRFGPFVQIGTKDDEEKPRFAGLRPGQKMDHITLADAMELFMLPRTLGETAAGETIVANVGRFGPYVKYGSKYASLKEDDPYTVTLERAREVIRLKQEADAARLIQDFPDAGIQVLNGRYGPYITDKKKNAKIPKERDPKTLTLEECRTLLAAAPERGGRFGRWGRGRKAAAPAAGAPTAAEAVTASTAGRKKAATRASNGAAAGRRGAARPRRPASKAAAHAAPARRRQRPRQVTAARGAQTRRGQDAQGAAAQGARDAQGQCQPHARRQVAASVCGAAPSGRCGVKQVRRPAGVRSRLPRALHCAPPPPGPPTEAAGQRCDEIPPQLPRRKLRGRPQARDAARAARRAARRRTRASSTSRRTPAAAATTSPPRARRPPPASAASRPRSRRPRSCAPMQPLLGELAPGAQAPLLLSGFAAAGGAGRCAPRIAPCSSSCRARRHTRSRRRSARSPGCTAATRRTRAWSAAMASSA